MTNEKKLDFLTTIELNPKLINTISSHILQRILLEIISRNSTNDAWDNHSDYYHDWGDHSDFYRD